MSGDAPDIATGRSGRNEALKPRASWLNTVSAGLVLAGFIQPLLASVQGVRPVSFAEWLTSSILVLLGGGAFVLSQRIAHRMED